MAQSSSKPLEDAAKAILWPYLQAAGFTKVSARKYAREKVGVFQQVWVDANGVSKAESTRIVLCATFPFASPNGYMDPHGFIVGLGKHRNMSTSELADAGMHHVVFALDTSELKKLDELSGIEKMLAAIKDLSQTPLQKQWHPMCIALYDRWKSGEPEALRIVSESRRALKL